MSEKLKLTQRHFFVFALINIFYANKNKVVQFEQLLKIKGSEKLIHDSSEYF